MEKHLFDFLTIELAVKAGLTSGHSRSSNPLITGIEYDSRNVKPGNLFFALPGLHTDGSLFINDAIANGASVIIHENDNIQKKDEIIYLKVRDARHAMSPVSAAFYDYPSRKLLVTGVTGTEGKSTTVYLIWQLLTMLGKKAGFFSTVQQSFGSDAINNSEHQTTPEAPVVQRMLRQMSDNGCEYAVVEASSHGLSRRTNRLGDVEFCSAVLTNVTHEHLEFHGTWEQYRDDKANLFRALDGYTPHDNATFPGPFGVINGDDKSARYFAKATHQKTFTYNVAGRDGDLILETLQSGAHGNWYTIIIPTLKERIELRDKLPGSFNVYNVLAALLTVSGLLSLPVHDIAPLVKKLKPVRGRMTTVENSIGAEIIVDYAHTPSSFKTVLAPLHERLNNSSGKLISVFGSAGERDTQKRPEQGKIAAEYSDILVLTDEDPRGEDGMQILEEIAAGTQLQQQRTFTIDENLFLIPDRPQAIRKALSLAKSGDIVIFLGKGHENSIIYKDHVMPFDEISEVEKALREF